MRKGRQSVLADTPPFSNPRISYNPRKVTSMIIYFSVSLNALFHEGRNYSWPRPDNCPRCRRYSVWGHGFTTAVFDGYDQPLPLKLYRCPDCGCVIRLRPKGFFKRFQAPIEIIRSSIACKSTKGRWLPGISRTRQLHWYRALCKRIKAFLTDTWRHGILAGFDYLVQTGQSPVSRSI